MSRCVDHHTHRCAVGAVGEMGGLRGPPESNGPPGELRLVGPASEPLALAWGNLPVCPECAAHPAPRDGYICRALTRAGRAPTPWGKASRPGRFLGVKAMRSQDSPVLESRGQGELLGTCKQTRHGGELLPGAMTPRGGQGQAPSALVLALTQNRSEEPTREL